MASINRVTLLGTISKYGVTVRYLDSGQPVVSFTVALSELGQDGREHVTLVDCQVFGKKAEAVSELEPGQLVVFEGRLQKRKRGESWETYVAGFEVQAVATLALTGSH